MQDLYLEKISLLYFKNYFSTEVNFSNQVNIIFGNNGEGKTNMLDAIHYLCLTKSFLNFSDTQNIHTESNSFLIKGVFSKNNITNEIACSVEKEQKKIIRKDKKNYEKFAEHIGQFPLVVISPLDFFLINEGSDYRRKFIDGMLSQLYSNYLENLVQYNKILAQRNSLLKTKQNLKTIEGLLDVYDFQLGQMGDKIVQERLKFFEEFINLCNQIYLVLSGNKEVISLEYQNSFNSNQLESELVQTRNKDLQIGYTGVGPHKDDLKFLLNNMPIKKFASQGQQKSFLISLKLAQYSIFKNHLNIKPILLLDDFHDKLDANRVGRLIDLLNPKDFGQIFITDTDEKKLIHHFEGKLRDFKLFNLQNSQVNEVSFKTLT